MNAAGRSNPPHSQPGTHSPDSQRGTQTFAAESAPEDVSVGLDELGLDELVEPDELGLDELDELDELASAPDELAFPAQDAKSSTNAVRRRARIVRE